MKPARHPRPDQRVSILQAVKATNGLGETIPSNWVVAFDTRAEFVPVSDGERWRAGAIEQKADARFTIRQSVRVYLVSGVDRLRFSGDDWQITGVKKIGRKWLEITAWKIEKAGG